MFILAARTEGKNPPIIPIVKANINDDIIIEGDVENENSNSENEPKLRVEIEKNESSEASKMPNNPPKSEIKIDSVRKAANMLRRLNPRALNVPTSTVRFATAEYIVIIAPIVAPKLKITVTKIPNTLINVAISSDCSSK